jgi:amino acid transporter
VFALNGFEQATQISGEARNPQRNVPRAVVVGTLLHLALEVAFIGALNPANLVHGWANPVGKGDFGPYATLATGLGLGWLAVILYVDAFISPAGTGLIYVGTSARLGYALGHAAMFPASSAGSAIAVSRTPQSSSHYRGYDLFSAIPELARPSPTEQLGNSDHVCVRADHLAGPAQG